MIYIFELKKEKNMNEKKEKQIKIENEIKKINKLFSELINYENFEKDFKPFIMGISFNKASRDILNWRSEVLSQDEVQRIKKKFLFSQKITKRVNLWEDLYHYCHNLVECLKTKERDLDF